VTATVQGLLLVGLFIVPGFVHYRFAKTRRVWQANEKFEITVVFTSIGITSIVVSLELLTVGALAFWLDPIDSRLHEGFQLGLQGYGRKHAAELFVTIPGVFLLNSMLLGAAGVLDPEGFLVEVLRRGKRATQKSTWYLAFRPDYVAETRKDSAGDRSKDAVLVYMKGESQPRYFGWVGAFDLNHDDQGEYYFQLWNPERRSGDTWRPTRLRGDCLSSVLLKTADIVAIEFTYGDVTIPDAAVTGVRAPSQEY